MRVFGRALVLGFLFMVCAPRGAAAAPIAVGDGASCGLGLTLNCGSFDLFGPSSTQARWDGVFGDQGSDMFLFAFSFDEATRLSVTTDSWDPNVDPTLGLFHKDGSIVTLADGTQARFFDIDIFGNFDDHIDVELAQGDYLLALVFGSLRESLQAGFDCDAGCGLDGGPAFGFDASVSPVNQPAPVPEPGTLTLMAGGAIAGLLQRRRTKKRQAHSSSVSR
jgi:PEP-CTERM motif-containing protein